MRWDMAEQDMAGQGSDSPLGSTRSFHLTWMPESRMAPKSTREGLVPALSKTSASRLTLWGGMISEGRRGATGGWARSGDCGTYLVL